LKEEELVKSSLIKFILFYFN